VLMRSHLSVVFAASLLAGCSHSSGNTCDPNAPNTICTIVGTGWARGRAVTPSLDAIHDAKRWRIVDGDADTARESGQSVVRLKPTHETPTGSVVALALVEGVALAEGTLEVDLKGRGQTQASFLGLAFDVVDASTFEAIYFRPFNFISDDTHRVHAVQYVSWPAHTWEKLRQATPGRYEAAVQPVPDPSGWFHARVEVAKDKVRVWVDGAAQPCLVVDRLGARGGGKVGLWVDSKEGSFRNLTITPAK